VEEEADDRIDGIYYEMSLQAFSRISRSKMACIAYHTSELTQRGVSSLQSQVVLVEIRIWSTLQSRM